LSNRLLQTWFWFIKLKIDRYIFWGGLELEIPILILSFFFSTFNLFNQTRKSLNYNDVMSRVFVPYRDQLKKQHDCQMMASKTAKFFPLLLLTNFLCYTQVASRNTRQPLVQRGKPLPGSPVKLQVINLEKSSSLQNEDEFVVDGIVEKIMKRSRRAVNPDFSPKIVRVSINLRKYLSLVFFLLVNYFRRNSR